MTYRNWDPNKHLASVTDASHLCSIPALTALVSGSPPTDCVWIQPEQFRVNNGLHGHWNTGTVHKIVSVENHPYPSIYTRSWTTYSTKTPTCGRVLYPLQSLFCSLNELQSHQLGDIFGTASHSLTVSAPCSRPAQSLPIFSLHVQRHALQTGSQASLFSACRQISFIDASLQSRVSLHLASQNSFNPP